MLIATRNGLAIRFPGINDKGELEVRHMGRVARGVRGIDLKDGDDIASMLVIEDDDTLKLLTVTENGYGKRTTLERYRKQGRGGKGVIDIATGDRNGRVAGAVTVHDGDRIMLITDTGRVIKMKVDSIRETDRNTKGVTLMRVEDGERVVGVARVSDNDDEELETTELAVPIDNELDADDVDLAAAISAEDPETPSADGESEPPAVLDSADDDSVS